MSLFTWLIAADAIRTLGKALDEEMNEPYKKGYDNGSNDVFCEYETKEEEEDNEELN